MLLSAGLARVPQERQLPPEAGSAKGINLVQRIQILFEQSRLEALYLYSLSCRRSWGYLIVVYHFAAELFNCFILDIACSRGHLLKLFKPRSENLRV